jgi:lipoprotein signal peptidase
MAERASAKLSAAGPDSEASSLHHLPSYLRFVGVAALGLVLDLWSKHWAFHSLGQGHEPLVIIPRVLEFQTMLNSGALFGIGGGQTLLFLFASACALLLVFWMFSQTSRRRWALQVALGAILAGALGNMYDRMVVRLVDHAFPHGSHAIYTVRTGEDQYGAVLKEYPPDAEGTEYRMRAAPNAENGVIVSEYPRGVAFRLERAPGEAGFVRDFIKIPTRWFGGREVWPWVFNVADVLLVGGVAILAIHLWRDRRHRAHRPKPAASDSARRNA